MLAASTAALFAGVKAQLSYQGCVAVDPNSFADTTPLDPNSPETCATYCSGLGYQYIAVSAQFCSCSGTALTVTDTYADTGNTECSFNCDPPYEAEFCGGIDSTTLSFIYSYYIVSGSVSVSVSQPATVASSSAPAAVSSSTQVVVVSSNIPVTTVPATPSTTSSAAADPADGTSAGAPIAISSGVVIVPSSTVVASADPALVSGTEAAAAPDVVVTVDIPTYTATVYTTTTSLYSTCPACAASPTEVVLAVTTCYPGELFTSQIAIVTEVPCSGGWLETQTIDTVTVFPYNPAESTTTVITEGTTTRTVLIPVTHVLSVTEAPAIITEAPIATPIATPIASPSSNGTNITIVVPSSSTGPFTAVVTAGATTFADESLKMAGAMLGALMIGAVMVL